MEGPVHSHPVHGLDSPSRSSNRTNFGLVQLESQPRRSPLTLTLSPAKPGERGPEKTLATRCHLVLNQARIANAFREALLLPVASPTPVVSLMAVPEVSQTSPEAEPILRIRDFRDAEPTPRFTDIEDVPDGEIARVLLRLAVTFGVTPREDLIKSTAHELGFERTGKRISARIESVIQSLVQQGRLRDAGDERLGVSS